MSDVPQWRPSPARAASSSMEALRVRCEALAGAPLPDYAALHRFAVDAPHRFWPALVAHLGIAHDGSLEPGLVGREVETARFFPALRLDWSEHLLRPMAPEVEAAPALVYRCEDGARQAITRAALRDAVEARARALVTLGLRPGDRVVAVARNDLEAAAAALAVARVGAVWSSVSPELSTEAAAARFEGLSPTLLLTHTAWQSQGRRLALDEAARALAGRLPSLAHVVTLDEGAVASALARGSLASLAAAAPEDAALPGRFAFDHPLFVAFSSGTTGAPKRIVHGHGGTLVEHAKELALHTDLRPGDALLFVTTTAWMMWNWQLSALATGARVVLYDGAASHPEPDAVARVAAEEGVTVLGASPAWVQLVRAMGVAPVEAHDLSRLRAFLSTGSPLTAPLFDEAQALLGPVQVQSISGGTDLLGCFFLGNPTLPVHRGECQCVSLGLDVRVHDGAGMRAEGDGDLVCASPFPSRPVGFWGDDGSAFHAAYFAAHEGVWTHGDLVTLTARGTAVVHGRSDGVMNLRGVRVGPAELYRALHDVPELAAALATDQPDAREPGGRRLVLAVVMAPGHTLDRALTLRIKRLLRDRASPVHVPAVIAAVPALPVTHNGKVSERAAQDALAGRPVRNLSSLRDPAALDALVAAVRAQSATS